MYVKRNKYTTVYILKSKCGFNYTKFQNKNLKTKLQKNRKPNNNASVKQQYLIYYLYTHLKS